MIPRIGVKPAMVTAAVLALSGAGALAVQAPASASTITATYSCNVPLAGTKTVTLNGSLTPTPNPATAGSAVSFAAHVTSLSLSSPLAINSWSATAAIAGSGAQTSAFNVTGSGGSIPANQPIANLNLSGSWTPTVNGTDSFVIGNITIKANVALLGNVTIPCTPSGTQPVAATLTVG
jgi:hypothetical protein